MIAAAFLLFKCAFRAGSLWKGGGISADHSTVEISPLVNVVFEQIRERIAGMTRVQSVAAGIRPPFGNSTLGGLTFNFTIEGQRPGAPGKQTLRAAWFPVSGGYFRTLGVPLLRGREFGNGETATSLPTVVINEALACRLWSDHWSNHWSNQDPLGKHLRIDMPNEPSREIVGVVGDLRHNRYQREAQPQMYVPYVQHPLVSQDRFVEPRLTMTFVGRSTGEPMRSVSALRAAVAEVDRSLPVFNVKTVDEYVAGQLWQPRQPMILLSIFSGIAVVRAMAGVYAVRQRTPEIGIRIALGASRKDVLRMVMAQGVLLVALGTALGVAGASAFTRVLQASLWGVTPTDSLTYGVVGMALVAAALVACYLPARKALEIEPLSALRHE